jgi:hypothetical protein
LKTEKLGFDYYELRARVAPGLVLGLPVLATFVYAAPALIELKHLAAGSLCAFSLIYALGQVARARGGAIEGKLWSGWGGPPSTRFLRTTDSYFGPELKEKIRTAVLKTFSLQLPRKEDEKNTPASDRQIDDAFKLVRDFLRATDPRGLWFDHMVEYGFARNLLGMRVPWLILSLSALLVCLALGGHRGDSSSACPTAICALSVLAAIYLGWFVLPGATKRIAETYAGLAWTSFLRTAEIQHWKKQKQQTQKVRL